MDRGHPHCRTVRRALVALRREGVQLCVAPQNFVEFWAVATRPVDANGLGMSGAWAAVQLKRMKRLFLVLAENVDVQPEWERLVVQHGVAGKKVHDAKLVATMNVHNVSRILTFNTDDFSRYPGVVAVSPLTSGSSVGPPRKP